MIYPLSSSAFIVVTNTTARRSKALACGLSIVRRAVEAHGGTIDLTSTPGVETTFTMRVPLT
jgi:signal transduction histidine kinase